MFKQQLLKYSLPLFLIASSLSAEPLKDTLPTYQADKVPKNFEEMWKGFDPRKEPLDVEVLHETEQDAARRYCIDAPETENVRGL